MRRALALAFVAATAVVSFAQADEETEARLRDALRTATGQLRSLEDERTVLQAKLGVAEKERDALKAQITALNGQVAAGKKTIAAQDQAAAERETQITEQAAAIDKIRGVLGQCRTSVQKATAAGQALEETGRKLSADLEAQTRRAEACEAKNIQLYKTGSEILDAYASKDFGDVLGSEEPFLGLKRVELENLVQDYEDKLLEGKIAP